MQIRDIYAYYVVHTAITCEYEVPSLEKMRDRIERTLRKYPYTAAEEKGEILGYAGPFKQRAAWDWSVETGHLRLYRASRERTAASLREKAKKTA